MVLMCMEGCKGLLGEFVVPLCRLGVIFRGLWDGGIYLVVRILVFRFGLYSVRRGVEGHLELFVTPMGHQRKGKRSKVQSCHQHGGVSRATWGGSRPHYADSWSLSGFFGGY